LGIITLAFSFTGYLLPWDQRAYWATTIGTDMAGSVPLVGDILLRLLRGGSEITALTLTRFYGAHVLILPVVFVLLLGAHFIMIRRQGISGPL
jgi:quinol-cytochrome oxidoreductase complex cytochrome b subunit